MGLARWLDGSEGRLWIAYLRGSRRLDQVVESKLRASERLTHAEFEILTRLATAPSQQMRMGVLSEVLFAPKTRLNYQIGQLEKRGLVDKVPDEQDGRGLNAVLTSAGREVYVRAAAVQIATVRRHLLDPLSTEQRHQLLTIMNKIADAADSSAGCGLPKPMDDVSVI